MILKTDKNGLLKLLLRMVALGSIFGIENSQLFGCVTGLEMFTFGNLLFFTISFVLLYKAYNSKSQTTINVLVIIEFVIWILKYIFYKGGYITGFIGTPSIVHCVYDFCAIAIRSYLILSLLSTAKFNLILSLLISSIFLVIKINIFSLPWITKKMWEIEDQRAIKQRSEIVGKYEGTITHMSDTTSLPIELEIDSIFLRILNTPPFGLAKRYQFMLEYPHHGFLGSDSTSYFTVTVRKFNNDSLILELEEYLETDYVIKLRTER